MLTPSAYNVTELLLAWRSGDQGALERLMPVVYQELRRLAGSRFRRERSDHTLQPTALIHEATCGSSVRVIRNASRAHFFGFAARLMRQILVDHARRHNVAKRGGRQAKEPLDEAVVYSPERAAGLVALDEALDRLAGFDRRKARVVELRFFGGLSLEETATALGVSVGSVRRDVRLAEACSAASYKHKQTSPHDPGAVATDRGEL